MNTATDSGSASRVRVLTQPDSPVAVSRLDFSESVEFDDCVYKPAMALPTKVLLGR